MSHAISNAGSYEASLYFAIDKDESRRRAHDQMQDRLRDQLTWSQLDEIMGNAPKAQREAFWSHVLKTMVDTDARLLPLQNVKPMAEALQDAVALAIDEQATQALKP
ncbi:hypothetical protein ACVTMO_16825 [Pseudomonas segetis]